MARNIHDRHWTRLARRSALREGRLRSERGVSLIHVAVVIFVLVGFSAFVLDHGVLMLARAQVQNAADAAAIAAVTTRVKDEPGAANPAANGITEKVIQKTVDQHSVFGGTPANIGRTWGWACPAGVTGWCAQVNVFRDATNGSTALPAYFANVFGINHQEIRATASAVAAAANGTSCMKPWLIPDQWEEHTNPADRYNPPGDIYTPYNYNTNTPGTGYKLPDDQGDQVVLKPGNPHQAISASDFYEILTATDYEESIVGCKITKTIGQTVTVLPGNRVGPTNHGVDTLLANGPVDIVVGMFSPAEFENLDHQHGNFDLHIVNMMSVHVTGRNGNQIEGTIIGGVGEMIGGGGPAPSGGGSLIKVIQLVR